MSAYALVQHKSHVESFLILGAFVYFLKLERTPDSVIVVEWKRATRTFLNVLHCGFVVFRSFFEDGKGFIYAVEVGKLNIVQYLDGGKFRKVIFCLFVLP